MKGVQVSLSVLMFNVGFSIELAVGREMIAESRGNSFHFLTVAVNFCGSRSGAFSMKKHFVSQKGEGMAALQGYASHNVIQKNLRK